MTGGVDLTAVGVDVGATKILGVRIDRDGRVLARAVRSTPNEDAEQALADVAAVIAAVREDHELVGVGVPGLVDAAGVMHAGANVTWSEVPVRERLAELIGSPVVLDNDCTVGAFAEWRAGAARGVSDVLYVGVGTGIGGGLVQGGRLVRGAHGFAGEIGHIIVQPGGEVCGCGNHGCWETVASGSTIARDGQRAVTRHPYSIIGEMVDGDPAAVTGETVTEAAVAGDPAARGILAEVGTRLGEGIGGLVNVLDPAMVVVGGGAAGAGDLLLEPARVACRRTIEHASVRPEVPIVAAAFGGDGAAIGAALLALEDVT